MNIRLFLCLLLLGAAPALAADEIVSVPGTKCPAGMRPLTFDEGRTHKSEICNRISSWDIVRIGERGSVSGMGYSCTVMADDKRALGATICWKPGPPPPPKPVVIPAGYQCTTPRCGVKEAGHSPAWGRHDCSGLTTPSLRTHCEARNAKVPAVEAKCAPLQGKKSYNACMKDNDPKVYDSFGFTNVDFLNCENVLPPTCKDQVPSWLLFGSGGRGQVQNCEQTPRSASCATNMRLYKLCGDNLFLSHYYAEECLIRARK
jgi:hypothetical protein